MYFPTAGIEVAPWVPPIVAFGISFFTSMGGVSGAFLILPFQMSFLGFTNPSVSSTNHLFNIVAIPSGVYRYIREGRMVWPLAWVVIIGTLPGVFIGALLCISTPLNFRFGKQYSRFNMANHCGVEKSRQDLFKLVNYVPYLPPVVRKKSHGYISRQ